MTLTALRRKPLSLTPLPPTNVSGPEGGDHQDSCLRCLVSGLLFGRLVFVMMLTFMYPCHQPQAFPLSVSCHLYDQPPYNWIDCLHAHSHSSATSFTMPEHTARHRASLIDAREHVPSLLNVLDVDMSTHIICMYTAVLLSHVSLTCNSSLCCSGCFRCRQQRLPPSHPIVWL
jgi:hypothetical protein